ncbi:MAG: sugar ABC transporter permease [Opitutales bacterium]
MKAGTEEIVEEPESPRPPPSPGASPPERQSWANPLKLLPNKSERRRIVTGVLFISPNLLGFLAFTCIPLVVSFMMAFTNWDLQQHNMFRTEQVRFVGLQNFIQLFQDIQFWKYLGNTLFLMLVIPFGIAGSLGAALLLLKAPQDGYHGSLLRLFLTLSSVVAAMMLAAFGMGLSGFAVLLCGLFGLVLTGGVAAGTTLYRTLFYLPHFTQGVAIYILWKKMYEPQNGPINLYLNPLLEKVETVALSLPDGYGAAGLLLFLIVMVILAGWGGRRMVRAWLDAELGSASLLVGAGFVGLAFLLAYRWLPHTGWHWLAPVACAVAASWVALAFLGGSRFEQTTPFKGAGDALIGGFVLLTVLVICLGLGLALRNLPEMAAKGLEAPGWISDYHWAKPSLMIMSLWAAIGSNNMILYLAGLSNIPPELYEAADIDGAGKWQKFRFVTWPQLAPVTFFIVIMSVIYGLQGGFEMARAMTEGGPAGATTTLSYYIYSEGFETGRLGYASAVAWVLFVLVFGATLLNWRVGSRHMND